MGRILGKASVLLMMIVMIMAAMTATTGCAGPASAGQPIAKPTAKAIDTERQFRVSITKAMDWTKINVIGYQKVLKHAHDYCDWLTSGGDTASWVSQTQRYENDFDTSMTLLVTDSWGRRTFCPQINQ
jgi:hypothetical protein